MNKRQQELFLNIVREHINSAKAIGSKFLVDKYNLDVSAATIRNDMAALEKEGLICQPYTSAGRVPTEKGYRYYLENYLQDEIKIREKDKELLDQIEKGGNEIYIKNIAKKIAELANAAVLVALKRNNIYYTGISNLFSQPEFSDRQVIYSISEVVDHLDEVIEKIFDLIGSTQVKIGRENYFDNSCASILTKTDNKLFVILGPMRMDYERNLGLLNYCQDLFPN